MAKGFKHREEGKIQKRQELDLETSSHNQWKILVISPMHTKSTHTGKEALAILSKLLKAAGG